MTFHVGQKVVCVDDNFPNNAMPTMAVRRPNLPRAGAIYTVRRVFIETFERGRKRELALHLYEIVNPEASWKGEDGVSEIGFVATRFRPLIERKTETGMSILRKIADDASKKLETV